MDANRGPQIVVCQRQGMDVRKLFERRADAQGTVDLRIGHGREQAGQVLAEFREREVAVRISEHGESAPPCPSRARNRQMVWVVRSELRWEPRISSILFLRTRDLSSAGNRTPTPWVRVPTARAGVTQPTLPAMG